MARVPRKIRVSRKKRPTVVATQENVDPATLSSDRRALDSAAQVKAISRFLRSMGFPTDFISPGLTPYFHYTDYAAFANIVMNKDLWLTDAGFSNDAEELEHGRLFIEETLREQARSGQTPSVRRLAKDVADLEAKARERKEPPEAVYVCCFCEDGDLLGQWRGYAANGGGVAIEIDQNAFSSLAGFDNTLGVMRFWKVFYREDLKKKRVSETLNFWSTQPEEPNRRAEYAAATLQFFVPTFKHPRFEAEAEWRLIFTPEPTPDMQPKFRVGRGLLVPYFELRQVATKVPFTQPLIANSGWFVIKSVRIGPGPFKDVNTQSAKRLLEAYGFPQAAVTRSEIPFRG